jgi:STE24 endopeptidase
LVTSSDTGTTVSLAISNKLTSAHPTKLLLIAQSHLLFTLTLFKLFINNKALFAAFGFDSSLAVSGPNGSPQPIVIGFMLFQLVSGPLDSIVSFFMHAQTRKYEYQAGEWST